MSLSKDSRSLHAAAPIKYGAGSFPKGFRAGRFSETKFIVFDKARTHPVEGVGIVAGDVSVETFPLARAVLEVLTPKASSRGLTEGSLCIPFYIPTQVTPGLNIPGS